MIICSNCGSIVETGKSFCVECGEGIASARNEILVTPSHTGTAAAPAREYLQTVPATQPLEEKALVTQSLNSANATKILLVAVIVIAVAALAIAVYALRDSPASRVATAMRSAVNNGRLVTLSNDDAYSYYLQLQGLDPGHKDLTEVAAKVLPQLRNIGDETFRKKVSIQTEKDTTQDWMRTARVYEWAHALAPNDKEIEARWRFAEGEVAKLQGRKDDAARGYSAAAQVNKDWALPQNSLGLLRSENKKYSEAITYFQRAIDMQPDWEIPYNNLGTAYYYLKDYDSAQSWYQKAIEKNRNWARPHFWLGSIYEHRKWNALAIEEYKAALSLNRDGSSLNLDEIQKRIERLQR